MLLGEADLIGPGWEIVEERTWPTGGLDSESEKSKRALEAGGITAWRSLAEAESSRTAWFEVVPYAIAGRRRAVAPPGPQVLRGHRPAGRDGRRRAGGRRPGASRIDGHLDLREVDDRAREATSWRGTWGERSTASCSSPASPVRTGRGRGPTSWTLTALQVERIGSRSALGEAEPEPGTARPVTTARRSGRGGPARATARRRGGPRGRPGQPMGTTAIGRTDAGSSSSSRELVGEAGWPTWSWPIRDRGRWPTGGGSGWPGTPTTAGWPRDRWPCRRRPRR